MEDNIRAYTSLRIIGFEAIASIEKEIVEEHIKSVYENLQCEKEINEQLDDCVKEILACYRLKRRLNKYVDDHLCDSQYSPLV
jgi:hypothetical protein